METITKQGSLDIKQSTKKKQYFGNGKNADRERKIYKIEGTDLTIERYIHVYSYRWHKEKFNYYKNGELLRNFREFKKYL
jgi:hypothetical protein